MKRADLINEAIRLLDAGTLATSLPNRLMERFKIPATEARQVAGQAIKQRQKRESAR